ncbi:MAG: tRNA (N(6)-L-threonylcarbamoyladenosine(37)-C(2))-methylthiotransferase MtaB [Patescibacteria group bacterium]|nr:tRNA (N(6)-L-threonylcarbamoyladenosine(37)-C(2))-methylthiotransferase MtaB [Patescibacteria group bacterium]
MQKIAFYTLGCRLNQSEEEFLRRKFLEAGFIVVEPKTADIIVINTCSVTGVADKKSRQAIRALRRGNSRAKIVVMGCGAKEAKGIEGIDLFILNSDKENAFQIITDYFDLKSSNDIADLDNLSPKSNRTRALLKVQDGCNNFCAYCIVPYLRGREVSIKMEKILKESKELEKLGYKEIVISGVNVGRYKDGTKDLKALLEEILKTTSFPRIRLSSVNPQDISDELITLWKTEERLCRYFHLSLQSGSDTVLKRMGRPYDTKGYLDIVKRIRKAIPEVAITTDVIVGFPGETNGEFTETCDFVRKVGFAKLHVFPYSKRTGTKAAEMEEQVEEKIKKERAKKLREIGEELREGYIKRFVGQELLVLLEEKKGEYWYGLTGNYLRVKYKSKENLENNILVVKLTEDNIS